MEAKLLYCVNGDGNPVCPPSKILCHECQEKITAKLEAWSKELKEDKFGKMMKELREKVVCPKCGKKGDYYTNGHYMECIACGYIEWQTEENVNLFKKWSEKSLEV